MGRLLIRSALVPVVSFLVKAEQLLELVCQRCRSPMDLHQPDSNQPDQFLATCPRCGLWVRAEAKADERTAVVVQLPEVEEIRARRKRPLKPPRQKLPASQNPLPAAVSCWRLAAKNCRS